VHKRDCHCHEYGGEDHVAWKVTALPDPYDADKATSDEGQSNQGCSTPAYKHGDCKAECVNGRGFAAYE
jgi:hypothetical protein